MDKKFKLELLMLIKTRVIYFISYWFAPIINNLISVV